MSPDETRSRVSPRDDVYRLRSVKRETVPTSLTTEEDNDGFDLIREEDERPSRGKRIVAIVRKAQTRKMRYLMRAPPPSRYTAANVSV